MNLEFHHHDACTPSLIRDDHSDVPVAVQAMKAGAIEFFTTRHEPR